MSDTNIGCDAARWPAAAACESGSAWFRLLSSSAGDTPSPVLTTTATPSPVLTTTATPSPVLTQQSVLPGCP
eukprot:3068539-Rhodomonas_salina.1